MSIITQKKFYAKLILAGEYLILHGYKSLAVPLKRYYGTWEFKDKIDFRLIDLYNYIETQNLSLDLNQFNYDINKGLHFTSNIPSGYGCGSSGALSAAIYYKYGDQSISIDKLHQILINLENYYHGNSSGIDPLVSYLNKGVIINDKKISVSPLESKLLKNFYLFDSTVPRNTASLVKIFQQKMKDKVYSNSINELAFYNKQLIEAFIDKNKEDLLPKTMKKISTLQFNLFDFAIPSSVKLHWQKGLEQGEYFKLCGAGGGGYFLVYTTNSSHSYLSILNE